VQDLLALKDLLVPLVPPDLKDPKVLLVLKGHKAPGR